jgi:hypothetical protein
MRDALSTFERLLHEHLIPEFCRDPKRGCECSGFKGNSAQVNEDDARYFLSAIDNGLVKHLGNGLYRAPKSAASEQFFWQGPKAAIPKTYTLWLEPIITVAALGRLHFDYNWPKALLGTQSSDWAFDVTAFLPEQPNMVIAGEVKKSTSEVERLLQLMEVFGLQPDLQQPVSGKERNAYKKVVALRSQKPPVFWALGPANFSRVFAVDYGSDGIVKLSAKDESLLACPKYAQEADERVD